ncbi:hypothetical protein CY0110_18362 [Crocosphaera chwakensis CCY0110]|uniref:Uncharacterized protein n=1 Tax=Crocosphaera chwakensis CCY0110 TaxID=391612 RepID=A3IJ04_9CHRO|nr:hypothetical protein CY0110_18362 [Crocosphaera chwakensis CCY0110]
MVSSEVRPLHLSCVRELLINCVSSTTD